MELKANLRKIESNLFHIGLYANYEICTVEHNGRQMKFASYNIARNGNLVSIWYDRAPSGYWCIPKEIIVKNEKTGREWRFYS